MAKNHISSFKVDFMGKLSIISISHSNSLLFFSHEYYMNASSPVGASSFYWSLELFWVDTLNQL